MSKNKELIIVGCGGHGRTVLDVVLNNNPDAMVTFIDQQAKPEETIVTKNPARIFNVLSEITPTNDREFLIALGDNQYRRELRESLGDIALAKVISSNALLGTDAKIGDGTFIGHQVIVGPFTNIGEGVIINTRSHISHEVEVGDYSQLALDVTVGGRTKIGDNVFIGMKSCVFDGLIIASDVIIGANSTVTKDITEPGTYFGSPVRLIK